MPITDYDPRVSMDQNLTATYIKHIMNEKINHIYSQAHTASQTHKQETLEWAKFAMWLRGFLSALEGKELTSDDREKIMDKLATVDPESQGWRYNGNYPDPAQYTPPQPHPRLGAPVWPTTDRWVYTETTTGNTAEDMLAKIASGITVKDGK